jgi:site-specific DNA-methyltransferase (adenine-specific)
MGNHLYYGDNLTVLREQIRESSVDLIYLDPPFNSNASYNVLFKGPTGSGSAAQIEAFDDTWHWNDSAEEAFGDVVRSGNAAAATMLRAMRSFLGDNDMMAYLAMMAVRLLELHRVLKPTGSLYLHCDPTASHYLKILLDAVFGAVNYRNELIWQRVTGKSLMKRRLPTNHDVLLVYQKTEGATWNDSAIYVPYDLKNLPVKTSTKYSHRDPDGRVYRLDNLINPNSNRPNLTYEFLGVTKVWRWTRERMQAAYRLESSSNRGREKSRNRSDILTSKKVSHFQMSGLTSLPSTPKPRNASATPPRNPWPCWSASSAPRPIPAMWCWTRSAAAAPRCMRRRSWGGSGWASTSPIWRLG